MQPYANENNGYRYILVVIDCYSKYVWTRPLRNKTGIEVTNAMKDVIRKTGSSPTNLQSDNGTEFYNRNFSALMKSWDINHYSTFSTKKAAIVERVIRTLKTWLYTEFSARGSYNWLNILPTITRKYNNKIHRTINMRPSEVTSSTLLEAYSHPKIALKPKYHIGDIVRISKYKGVFDKGVYCQLFNRTFSNCKDMNGQQIKGCFYEHELQKTKYPDVYLVEKVLKKKKNKVYVKWLGFSKCHNSWIEETAICMYSKMVAYNMG
ncbi:hypothetical protein NQ317_003177 [Molorchus minor]|uniref:Integrase catalytic domain-containing protein n=1 Tax=Molorchus minor TaxID=1323400 RepID=A0ABQ9JA27_9CUCU|nr:hypothetical protein NQ317_003177 [Molorchus minor]